MVGKIASGEDLLFLASASGDDLVLR
jgi:hypothetical protein